MNKQPSNKCEDNGQWMTSTNKKRTNKNKKNQRNGKKNKQNKNKGKQGKKQQPSPKVGVPETVPESSVDTDLAKKDLNSNSANVQKLEVKEQEQEKPKEEAVKELKTKKNPVQAKETPKSKGISFLSLFEFVFKYSL